MFENFIKVSIDQFDINPLYNVSSPAFTWQCGLKITDKRLQILQDKETILLLENIIRGGISTVMDYKDVESDDSEKILYIDANIFYAHPMSQPLPVDD